MKQFETETFVLLIHENGLKEIRIKKNKILEEKDVWESDKLSISYMPGVKFYVLLEGEEGSDVSMDAKRAAASGKYSEHVEALALCSHKVLEAIKGNLFLKINRPKVPTKFFDNRDAALKWLEMQRTKANKTA